MAMPGPYMQVNFFGPGTWAPAPTVRPMAPALDSWARRVHGLCPGPGPLGPWALDPLYGSAWPLYMMVPWWTGFANTFFGVVQNRTGHVLWVLMSGKFQKSCERTHP